MIRFYSGRVLRFQPALRETTANGRALCENGEFFVGGDPAALYARVNAHVREMFR